MCVVVERMYEGAILQRGGAPVLLCARKGPPVLVVVRSSCVCERVRVSKSVVVESECC